MNTNPINFYPSLNSMANTSNSSGELFSFPAIITVPELEYSDRFEPNNSPADRLFFNGKLLPHVFPTQTNNFSYSRSTSRTSSTRSSLMSSRSNSTNSRSSNCSSARTSTSEISERIHGTTRREKNNNNSCARINGTRVVQNNNYQCGTTTSAQRWQFIAAAPVLTHQGSRSRRPVEHVLDHKGSKKSKAGTGEGGDHVGRKAWFGRRILKSFVSACKECHAIKTANVEGGFKKSVEL